jgi:hypothetical protein
MVSAGARRDLEPIRFAGVLDALKDGREAGRRKSFHRDGHARRPSRLRGLRCEDRRRHLRNPSESEITMLDKLLRSSSKKEKTDIRDLLDHVRTLKKQSTVWRKAKKSAESLGIVDIDGYFKKDFSSLLDKHAKAYEKVTLLLKPAKSDRDLAAIKRERQTLRAILGKLNEVYMLYKAIVAGGVTTKAKGLLKQDRKAGGGKVLPQDKALELALGAVSNTLLFDFDRDFERSLGDLAPYIRDI